jgi:hypothetical protein
LSNDDKPNAYKTEGVWVAKINALEPSTARLFQEKGRSNNTTLFKAKSILKYNIQIYFYLTGNVLFLHYTVQLVNSATQSTSP